MFSVASSAHRNREPVTVGVPFPKGLTTARTVEVISPDGSTVPCQWRALDNWSDGSARWVLLDFQVDCHEGEATKEAPQ